MTTAKKLIAAAGAAGAAGEATYVEDVFSTYLYDGNGSTQTINNGINLAGEGGLVWIKNRSYSYNHYLFDTARGAEKDLSSNSTAAQNGVVTSSLSAFTSTGFSLGRFAHVNEGTAGYEKHVSWTFRKAPGFFDVVTYTGDGVEGRTVNHNLGSVPGMIIIKNISNAFNWIVYHRSSTNDLNLNNTNQGLFSVVSSVSSTSFALSVSGTTNASGSEYVAYIFAHNDGDGEFGENADQDIIKCGSFSSTGFVDLGFEPQWVLMKSTTNTSDYTGDWRIFDSMRGIIPGDDAQLFANSSREENTSVFATALQLNATGFTVESQGNYGDSTIYIAIRRGPMKTPESGTEVFSPNAYTGDGTANRFISTSMTPDLIIGANRNSTYKGHVIDRLRGRSNLVVNTTAAEATPYDGLNLVTRSGGFVLDASTGGSTGYNISSNSYMNWAFKRAPGFFDVVAYEGNATAGRTVSHNLGVVPELMIVKQRTGGNGWRVYVGSLGNNKKMYLYATTSAQIGSEWNRTSPTDSVFSVGGAASENGTSHDYIAYLFATLPGISKVGSYTGTGSNVDVDCGFSAGARFVLIKRTDSTGDWYVWDSARGIVAGNDPYILLNNNAAEVTSTDYIDPLSSGFTVTSSAPAALNASGGNYVFLAIA